MQVKWLRRGGMIATNALLRLLPGLTSLGAAWWVIQGDGEATWGEFVDPLILVGLALHILSWGNQEFLLRAFALRPDAIQTLWKQALVARGTLLFMIMPLIFLTDRPAEQMTALLGWVLFGYVAQSFNVVVTYQKDFVKALVIELVAIGGLFAALFLSPQPLGLTELIRYFALSQAVRALALGLLYRKYFTGTWPSMQFKYFSTALPFFLLGFAGMLVTRTDLFFVAYWLDDVLAGRYQILISLMTYIQAGAGFLIYPFMRNMYRLPDKSIRKLSLKVMLGGIGLTGLGMVIAWLMLGEAYQIEFTWEYYALGAASVWPVYAYTCIVLLLYKHKQQQKVLLANVGGILLNLAINLILTPRIGMLGALWGSVVCQFFLLTMLYLYSFRLSQSKGREKA